jgi:hypothetical protein
MKTFHNKQKLKQFMTTKPALHKILKGRRKRKRRKRRGREIRMS